MLDQIGSQRWKAVKPAFGPAVLDRRVLTFEKTSFIEAAPICVYELLEWTGCCATEEPNHRQHPLPCVRRGHPTGAHAAKERDEVPSSHRAILQLEENNLTHH
jgi:hypothetical protein